MPVEFNFIDQSENKTLCNLIGKNEDGAKWRALYYKPASPSKKKNMKGPGNIFAEGFTTLSDEDESGDDDNKTASLGSNEKWSSRKKR